MKEMENVIRSHLIEAAVLVKPTAYCPYSNFHVGASILGANGKIYTGINVENCAYPSGCCAEVTAAVKAVSDGCNEFLAVVVSTDCENAVWPCGQCRQFLSEFRSAVTEVIAVNVHGITESKTLEQLLPFSFTLPSS